MLNPRPYEQYASWTSNTSKFIETTKIRDQSGAGVLTDGWVGCSVSSRVQVQIALSFWGGFGWSCCHAAMLRSIVAWHLSYCNYYLLASPAPRLSKFSRRFLRQQSLGQNTFAGETASWCFHDSQASSLYIEQERGEDKLIGCLGMQLFCFDTWRSGAWGANSCRLSLNKLRLQFPLLFIITVGFAPWRVTWTMVSHRLA